MKWTGDSTNLTVVYKILNDSTPIPVNSVLYHQDLKYINIYLK